MRARHASIVARLEPAAALAAARVADDAAQAHVAARAALDALRVIGPAHPKAESVGASLKPIERSIDPERAQFHHVGDAKCRIDAQGAGAIVRAALDNVELQADAIVIVTVDLGQSPPLIDLTLEGPGAFPAEWFIGGVVPVSFEDMQVHWTRHTGGGRMDRTPTGLAMKLVGQREPAPNPPIPDGFADRVVASERALRLVAAGDAGANVADAERAAMDLVNAIDAQFGDAEPADLCALLRSVVEGSNGVEVECSESLPPIRLRRNQLANALRRFVELAADRLEAGAPATIMAAYVASDRVAEFTGTFPRAGHDLAWQALCAALAHVVESLHDGEVAIDVQDDECGVSFTLPDSVGRALDEWIPGFDAFSARSQQMLRLLQSGGQAPPEELILGGVLESELETWLLPRYESAAAVNVAHEMGKGKHSPPLEKALTQIRKGKTKKEIAQPAYAVEVIAAFRGDDRGRMALGLDALEPGEVDTLMASLGAEPIGYVTCLRLLAKIMRGASV